MKVSIITVCFNSARTISSTLESICRQSYQNIEHVVVDGGSTDDTLELLSRWQGHRLCILHGPDHGIYDAMNKGIAACTGDLVGFLNADDRYADTQTVSQIVEAIKSQDVDCCFGDLVFVDASTTERRITRYWQGSPYSTTKFRFGWLPAHPTLYVRRELMAKVGNFVVDYAVAGDVEWMMRLFLSAPLTVYIPDVLVEMDAGGASNAGWRAFLSANRDVWQACRLLNIFPAAFVLGKTIRKIPQWLHRNKWRPGFLRRWLISNKDASV